MSEITLFLLTLIGALILVNGFLWLIEKRNKTTNKDFETTLYIETQKPVQKDLPTEIPDNNARKEKTMQKSNRVKILEQYLKKM